MKLPTLFAITKLGKRMEWRVWSDGDTVYHCFGEVGGKMRDPVGRVMKEVNVGRKNYRSAEEQAINFAKKKWAKQLDKNYEPDEADEEGKKLYDEIMKNKADQGGNNHSVSKLDKGKRTEAGIATQIKQKILPMLAHKFLEKKDKKDRSKKLYINFTEGVYAQPKLDGIRCIARIQISDEGTPEVVLTTRTGKQFVHLKHIRQDILKLLKGCEKIVLDGELYVHDLIIDGREMGYDERFEIITSACRTVRTSPHPQEGSIEYHVFDIVDDSTKQKERIDGVKYLFEKYEKLSIKMVETYEIFLEKDVYRLHDEFSQAGYEGVILRNKSALYKMKNRSPYLLKYKQFIDEECVIIGAKQGSGTEEGAVIWECEYEGKRFDCRPRGTIEKRREWFLNSMEYIGCDITVRFQELSSDGVPRFPVGISIRDYE